MPNKIGISRLDNPCLIGIAPNSRVAPNTRATLAMFEPKTLPMAISGTLSIAAIAETTISGADVPNATKVKPITIGLTCNFSAIRAECSINLSELIINMIRPIIESNRK